MLCSREAHIRSISLGLLSGGAGVAVGAKAVAVTRVVEVTVAYDGAP